MGEKIAASAPLTLSEGCNDAAKEPSNNIIAVPAPLTPNEGLQWYTRRKSQARGEIENFVSAPLTLREGRVGTQGVRRREKKCDKTKVFASQTRSDGGNKWRERVKCPPNIQVYHCRGPINESSNKHAERTIFQHCR
ncbi:unnamed protein product [Trichogramma brassicae]|uniref:Uncharacterized protein n=1 Tax=Trichogramma brassicae TaxID=86971 RepID=A0A6H5HWE5_9HYME|nr:unnamed protein product [Trichogramma brassicae]